MYKLAILFLLLQPSQNKLPVTQRVKPLKIFHSAKQFDVKQNRRQEIQRKETLDPIRNPNFNPNWGYEPYWAHGDFYFDKSKNDTSIPKQEDTLCGNVCPLVYIKYGAICGRNSDMKHKTFKNYCELVNEDCRSRKKWTMIYRGECQKELKTYPPHAETTTDLVVTRAIKYIQDFEETYPSTKTSWQDMPHRWQHNPQNKKMK